MPNWCRNNLSVSHRNSKELENLSKILDSNCGLFEAFLPNPSGQWDYSWSLENWGVKWDVNTESITVIQVDEDRIIIEFDTAWGFPKEFYQFLEKDGYEVNAMFHEEGMAFCGIYTKGVEDYYEYGEMTPDEIRAMIPEEIDDCFAISEMVEERMSGDDDEL